MSENAGKMRTRITSNRDPFYAVLKGTRFDIQCMKFLSIEGVFETCHKNMIHS